MNWKAALAGILAVGAIAAAAPALLRADATGYLAGSAPDSVAILPPPPTAGSLRDQADRELFRRTRTLEDTARWEMARRDNEKDELLEDQACALGLPINAQTAPRTTALLARVRVDARALVDPPKEHYRRKRPYLVDPGPTCVMQAPSLTASPDYPSGHTTFGWAAGLILAELAPDRATPILIRARAYGESRLVCGVHSQSAVEAGRTNGSILVAALHGSPEFRRDLDAARAEIAAARKAAAPPDGAVCAKARALAKTAY